jgi:hypothetical protein
MLRFLIRSGFVLLLISGTFSIQQVHGAGSQTSMHKKSVKKHSGSAEAQPAPTRVEVYNGATAQTQVFNPQLPLREGQGEGQGPSITRVDVYNGSSKQMQVFHEEPAQDANSSRPSRRKHGAQTNIAAAHPVPEVEILNGTTKQRKLFNGPNELNAPPSHRKEQPVVVGIASSGSETKAPPVVTGIESGSGQDGKITPPIAVGVSPAPPKRPPYTPSRAQ